MQQIVMQYRQEALSGTTIPFSIHTEVKMLYNPQLKSAYNFVPGIMGLVLMLICAMMTSISIVREKEQGTMEILLVSPVKPISIVLSKAVPYLLIAMIDVIAILLLSTFLLDVPIAGNIFLLLFLSMIFTLSALSLGLLISSVTETQQAAMLISGIGLMLPSILLSGLIFPIENMPWILRTISNIIPAKWFIMAVKDVMIKGLGFSAIHKECVVLLGMTVFLLTVSIKRFKNRL
jgi:ABC-2 type transport system permease protein